MSQIEHLLQQETCLFCDQSLSVKSRSALESIASYDLL